MYLYKKLDGEGNARGLISCSTPQPDSERLAEIDKVEFDAIQEQSKIAEDALMASTKSRMELLEDRVKDVEDSLVAKGELEREVKDGEG